MEILGLGTDIIEIERIAKVIARQGDTFLEKLFTAAERDYCSGFAAAERHYAGRFCAKEAVLKAAGCGLSHGVTWQDIEVLNDVSGKPLATLRGTLAELLGSVIVYLTISHCHSYATATAIITYKPKG